MGTIHGFQVKQDRMIAELQTKARLFRHVKTGAEVLSLSNDDENKVFGISFRTPPSNSTGVAHILEHSVLCGSRKYPVKEPFVELLKGSLQTFLNAMTYPDKTCYPVASQNITDFYNLMDVYLDAVFYPRLTPFVFQQEGWHFELEQPDQPLSYKGVVFNEMKGAYSSPDNLLAEYSRQSLFPGTPYGFDSGGDPTDIPSLTFEHFRAFHETYYHPSNARIYFYGDDDPDERLKIIDNYIKDFTPIKVDSKIPLQRPFTRPRRIKQPFMVGHEGEDAQKGMVTVNWLLSKSADAQINFALRMLEYILLGMPASPLRKALIDSGLGDDLAGVGLGTELRQIYFSAGLKGVYLANQDQIEALILETLKILVQKGIDPLTVDAALNTISFRLRENNTGSIPRGLVLMLRALTTWLYGGDPLALLFFAAPLESIEKQVNSNAAFFEELIGQYLLKNPHRTTLTLMPDTQMRDRLAEAERLRLDAARKGMRKRELARLLENTKALKDMQEKPDSPEALSSIPVLKLADLEKRNKEIPLSPFKRDETPILFHDLFTNGIVYLDLGLDLRCLPKRYLPYVRLFGRALVEMGTDKEDFVTLSQRISRQTGGVYTQPFASAAKNGQRCAVWLFLRSKAMQTRAQELLNILQDMLLLVHLDNQERFRQMVMEEKARMEQWLVASGHHAVNMRIRAHFGEAHWAAEQMGGISYLFFIRRLVRAVKEDWPAVLATLEHIRRMLINKKRMILNITLNGQGWSQVEPMAHGFLDALPQGKTLKPAGDWTIDGPILPEGMMIPSQVNYVGKGADIYALGYRFHGSAMVIARYLRNGWLWDRIRVQGGAYGAFCLFDRLSGAFTFVSYRDPNSLKTLEVFDRSAQYLRDAHLNEKEVLKNIIGAIGDLDAYRFPDAKGYVSMLRHLTADSDVHRQRMRDEILATRPADFRAFAQVLEGVKEQGVVKMLGAPSTIEEVSSLKPGWLEKVTVL